MTDTPPIFGLLLALVVLAGCASDPSKNSSSAPLTHTAVLEFVDRWVAAEASEDFDNLVPLIHPNAVYRSNDGDHVGLNAIRQSFEGTFGGSPEQNYYIENVKVTYAGLQSATVIYSWNWTGKTPAGTNFRVTGRGTKMIARDEAGLRLRLLHLNQDTAVAED